MMFEQTDVQVSTPAGAASLWVVLAGYVLTFAGVVWQSRRTRNRVADVGATAQVAADQAQTAASEVQHNHGSSMKDGVARIEAAQAALAAQLGIVVQTQATQGAQIADAAATARETRRDIGGIREELRQEREDRAALDERVRRVEKRD